MTEQKPESPQPAAKFATLPERIPLSATTPGRDTGNAPDFDGAPTEQDRVLRYPG